MKGYATFFVIAVMSLGLVFLLVTRARAPYDAPAADPEIGDVADGGDGGVDAAAKADAAAPIASGSADAAASAKPTERPLRVVTLGWELVAAGAALTGPDAPKTTLPLELAPETTLDAVSERLGRGGADPAGADVAVLPLPSFIGAYDRLKALDPRVFAVVGFSRGREEVHAAPGALLKAPPAADEVKLVTGGSESATVLGLFALDLLGVAPARVRLLPGSADAAKGAPFAAIPRGTADERKLALSSADASRFVPIVAVAAKKQLDDSEPKMRDFAKAWLDGVDRAHKDAQGIANRLSRKDNVPFASGVGGAPEALALIERLGQVDAAGLVAQRALMGAQAKGAFTMETLAQRQWTLARAGGLTTSATPAPLPFDERIITAIAPVPPAPPTHETTTDAGADAGAFAALPSGTTPLVAYRAGSDSDAAAVAAQIGFLAGVFERSAFRVTAKGGEKAARGIAALARDRFDLPASRLATGPAEPAGAFASVEIIGLP